MTANEIQNWITTICEESGLIDVDETRAQLGKLSEMFTTFCSEIDTTLDEIKIGLTKIMEVHGG